MSRRQRVDCLIIDDEAALSQATVEYFTMLGTPAAWAPDSAGALTLLANNDVGVILLDINLEGESGFALCRRLRRETDIPILFISARGGDDDILLGLGVGGDDYIAKPYSLAVLHAKVQAVLRRSRQSAAPAAGPAARQAGDLVGPDLAPTDLSPMEFANADLSPMEFANADLANADRTHADPAHAHASQEFRCGQIQLRFDLERAFGPAGPIALTAIEYALLARLARAPGQVVPKRELFVAAWGHTQVGEGALNVHIRRLRAKLAAAAPGHDQLISTAWGVGYALDPDRAAA
ncbi:MAG: response regulator transcription factor [Bifidobacteriaceae bacterium]|jgi:two-component system response regulator RegX3|nr:response regulator transcription factor [Bifidobacteriaceae bacterium]